jgi:threonine 3-dehydrogenase
MHTVMSAGVSGRSVLITGVGIIGLMAVTMARAAGAGTIVVSDLEANRLAIAGKLGADLALRGDDPQFHEKVRAATDGQGPEVLLEMSGSARAIRQGFAALRNGGTVALLGLPSKPVELDLNNDIIFKGATVLGINGRRMYETWFQVESFLLSRRLQLDSIVTHQLPLDEYHKAFKLMQSGEAIKVVLRVPQD